MADLYHWTPEQVNALDPEFVDEVILFQRAKSDHELLSADSKDNPQLKKAQARRKAELVKWRRDGG